MKTTEIAKAARDVVARLVRAWNRSDGHAFAEPFAPDADFANVLGEHHRGWATIAGGHEAIFASIYKGSRVRYEVVQARPLTTDVLLVHLRAKLSVPAGPLAGIARAIPSLVLVRRAEEWEVASFHNTPVAPPRPGAE